MNTEKYEFVLPIIQFLELCLPAQSLYEIKNTKYDELFKHHFGIGLRLRNNALSATSKLHSHFFNAGITQSDDMSSVIIKELHKRLNHQ